MVYEKQTDSKGSKKWHTPFPLHSMPLTCVQLVESTSTHFWSWHICKTHHEICNMDWIFYIRKICLECLLPWMFLWQRLIWRNSRQDNKHWIIMKPYVMPLPIVIVISDHTKGPDYRLMKADCKIKNITEHSRKSIRLL